jgi:hypothetical protein
MVSLDSEAGTNMLTSVGLWAEAPETRMRDSEPEMRTYLSRTIEVTGAPVPKNRIATKESYSLLHHVVEELHNDVCMNITKLRYSTTLQTRSTVKHTVRNQIL